MHGVIIAFIWLFLASATTISIVLPLTIDKLPKTQNTASLPPINEKLMYLLREERKSNKKMRKILETVAKNRHRVFSSSGTPLYMQ